MTSGRCGSGETRRTGRDGRDETDRTRRAGRDGTSVTGRGGTRPVGRDQRAVTREQDGRAERKGGTVAAERRNARDDQGRDGGTGRSRAWTRLDMGMVLCRGQARARLAPSLAVPKPDPEQRLADARP